MSGYDKSPDYGGGGPGDWRQGLVTLAIAAIVIAALFAWLVR